MGERKPRHDLPLEAGKKMSVELLSSWVPVAAKRELTALKNLEGNILTMV